MANMSILHLDKKKNYANISLKKKNKARTMHFNITKKKKIEKFNNFL